MKKSLWVVLSLAVVSTSAFAQLPEGRYPPRTSSSDAPKEVSVNLKSATKNNNTIYEVWIDGSKHCEIIKNLITSKPQIIPCDDNYELRVYQANNWLSNEYHYVGVKEVNSNQILGAVTAYTGIKTYTPSEMDKYQQSPRHMDPGKI